MAGLLRLQALCASPACLHLHFNNVSVVCVSLLPFKSHSVVKPPHPTDIFLSLLSSPKVKYKSDLNLTRGVGWTPPGSYKVEMARRAAELANRRGPELQGACVSNKQPTAPCLARPREAQTHCCFSKFIFGQRSASSKEP